MKEVPSVSHSQNWMRAPVPTGMKQPGFLAMEGTNRLAPKQVSKTSKQDASFQRDNKLPVIGSHKVNPLASDSKALQPIGKVVRAKFKDLSNLPILHLGRAGKNYQRS